MAGLLKLFGFNQVTVSLGAIFVGFPGIAMFGMTFGEDKFITRQQATLGYIELLLREREPFE